MTKEDDDNQHFRDYFYRIYGLYSAAGIQLVVAIVLLAWGGHYLDAKLATKPLFLIGGVVLGAIAGFFNIYRMFKAEKDAEEKENHESKSPKL